ncbi:MAG: hypothetical protein QGG36_01650, partial [Pirellulaceae bacterium]|nr:hypothetical protein [Pirellulaceae bacterium]
CCINCIHILPELKKLEHEYPNELVVIGVHAAKFDTEKDPKNISEAVLRYEIEHPVLVDSDHRFWQTLGVSSWPTVILIAPDGKGVWGKPGEIRFEEVNAHIKAGLPYFREKKILDETPIRFDLLADHEKDTPLRFPGKIMADEKGDRLFITDSNHNRIVVTAPDGKLLDIIGSGKIGRADGDFKTASFDHPQGLALTGDTLYVADTENHMIRKVDLKERQVTTISGTGSQGGAWPGIAGLGPLDDLPEKFVGKPKETALNSPWALWVHGKDLYIAMAGPHQIWKMPLDESEVGPFAGNGREDIVDGPLMPSQPYAQDASSFAQPSGLSSDGEYLFVADSEGSSIRAVPFDPKQVVKTVVGTAKLPYGRLFEFGDVDGPREQAKLQHALEVVYHEGTIYVADTYNNKVKAIDAETGETKTLAGTGKPGKSDDDGTFDEPAGLALLGGKLYVADTNNHLIRTIDLKTKRVGTFTVSGLKPTVKPPATKPDFALADEVELKPTTAKLVDGKVKFQVSLGLPEGWKMNPTAPLRYWTESSAEAVSSAAGGQTVTAPASQFAIELAAKAGESTVTVSVPFYYCQEAGGGLCKMGAVVFKIPLTVGAEGAEVVELKHAIE